MGAEDQGGDQRIVVKKYANRRLYNTATSSYVTLDHLARLTQEGVDFVVYDAKSGDDITRSVLTQIIVEEEAKGENLLPIAFLRQLITFYGDNMRWMVPQYLEHMIQSFAENQDRMRGAMQDAMGNLFPFGNLDDMRKQNMAFFEQAMRVWSPFAPGQSPGSGQGPGQGSGQGSGQQQGRAPGAPGSTQRPSSPPAPNQGVDPAELILARTKAMQDQSDLLRLKAEVESLKAALVEKTKQPEPVAVSPQADSAAPMGKGAAAPPEPANSQGEPLPSDQTTGTKPATAARKPAAKSSRAAPAKTAATKPPAAKRGRPPGSTRARNAKSQPTKSQPTKSEPAKAEPTKSEPTKSEPAKSQPTKSQPTKSQPTKSEPTKSEPTKSEPAKAPDAKKS